MGRSAEIADGNRRWSEEDSVRSCAAQLHNAQQALVRRNVQIETCMQAIIDKARKERAKAPDGHAEAEQQGRIDAIYDLAILLGIESVA